MAVIGRRWRVVVVLVLIGAVAALGYHKEKAVKYTSVSEVRVVQVTSNQFGQTSTQISNTVSMPTEQKIATSVPVVDAAVQSIGGGITSAEALANLKVTVPASTTILDFSYSAKSPKAAAAGAKAFEQAYRAQRKSSTLASIKQVHDTLDSQLNKLTTKQNGLLKKQNETTDPTIRLTLGREISALNAPINAVAAQLESLSNINSAGAFLVQPATLPTHPAGASQKILLSGGLVGGLILGLIAAFVIDATDDHLHGPKDLAALTGAPVLTRVPLLRSLVPWRRRDLAAEGTSHPKVAEAYRLLVNRLVVHATKDSISSVLVASPAQGEGRSSVAANLAATFVDLGFRVWLVSADLKPPQVHRLFSPDEAAGIVSVVPMTEAAVKSTGAVSELTVGVQDGDEQQLPGHGHLTLMASVERPRPAGRLLNPLVLARQVRQNQKLVDLTIIDAPALLDFADAVPLLPVVDGVIVVADAGTTRRSELIELSELLEGTHARVIGSVLNRDGARVVSRRARRSRRRMTSERTKPTAARPPAGAAHATQQFTTKPTTVNPTATSSSATASGPQRPANGDRPGGSGHPEPMSFIGWPDDVPASWARPPAGGEPAGWGST
jgi:Mrp family chromosome partitioning ATPase